MSAIRKDERPLRVGYGRPRRAAIGHEQSFDIGVQMGDNESSLPYGNITTLAAAILPSYSPVHCMLDVSNHGTLLKNKLILITLASLVGVQLANAQSSTTLIGLREVYWIYVADPSRATALRYMSHCRRFGLPGAEDIDPFRYPFFLQETGSISATDSRFGAMSTMHVQQGANGKVREMFWTLLPLPACKNGEA